MVKIIEDYEFSSWYTPFSSLFLCFRDGFQKHFILGQLHGINFLPAFFASFNGFSLDLNVQTKRLDSEWRTRQKF